MQDEELLEQAVRHLREYPVPHGPRPSTLSELSVVYTQSHGKRGVLGYMARRRTSIAVGGISVALLIGVYSFLTLGNKSRALAFEAVQKALAQVESVVVIVENPNRPWGDHKVFFRRGLNVSRMEFPTGVIALVNPYKDEKLVIDARAKKVQVQSGAAIIRSPLRDQRGFSTIEQFLDELKSLADNSVQPLGERTIERKRMVGFLLPRDQLDERYSMQRQIWVDPETRFPARFDYVPENAGNMAAEFRRFSVFFSINRQLNESLFDWHVPDGYSEADLDEGRIWEFAFPPTTGNIDLTIEPLVGIGAVQFGASLEEVIKAFGQPNECSEDWEPTPDEQEQINENYQKTRELEQDEELDELERSLRRRELQSQLTMYQRPPDGMTLNYHSMGFELQISNIQGLKTIYCNYEIPPAPAFTGKTRKGIGLQASAKEIIDAYGQPDFKNEYGSRGVTFATLTYASLAMALNLENGKLRIIRLDKDPGTAGYDKLSE